ncbi:15599_t:CDS:10 [Acaulospora morrowiae]|uniref:ubiquitinyl hydrolase 1 n=1 Tax=Acaulospora morrowiae TaxID=94023 RepID=A0A9N9A841_9GLOM|nr:15599_t:CDS:10 [Acaulospora morrowiae]
MAQKLPVDRESLHQEDYNGHELRGIEKQNLERKSDLLIEAEMENAAVIDPDAVNSDKDNLSKDLLCRQASKASTSSSRRRSKDDDHVTNWEEYVVRLREEPNPCKTVQRLITFADHILAGQNTSEDGQQIIYALNREWLPKYAIVLLNRGYPAVSSSQGNYMANIINQYLSKVLEIAIRLIEEPENINHIGEEFPLSEIMQDAVARILGDENASFYRRFDGRFESRRLDVGVNPSMMGIVGGAADTVEYDDSTSDIIAMEQLEPRISQYQYEAIQSFVSKGGLDAVLRALGYVEESHQQRNNAYLFNNLDLKDVHGLIRMVHKAVRNENSSMCSRTNCKYSGRISYSAGKKDNPKYCAYGYVHDSKLTFVCFRDYKRYRKELSFHVSSQLKIDIAARLLKTSRLDLRLTGLNEIKEALILGLKQARVLKKSRRRGNTRKRSLSVDGDDDAIQVDEENPADKIHRILNEKLREHGILEYIFGSNIHLEIIQRSTDILTFLIHTRSLTSRELDVIWAPVDGNQHRSIVHGVCQVLIDISEHLDQQQRDYLFQKLMKMPMSFIETQTFTLVKTLVQSTMDSVRSNGASTNYISFEAHRLLWRILCDSSIPIPVLMNAEILSPTSPGSTTASSGIDQEIAQAACQELTNLLQSDTHVEDRNKLLVMCIECLKRHDPGTMWALRILTRIISPPFQTQPLSTANYLQHLISTYNLPQLFLDDLEHWTKTVKSFAERSGNFVSMDLDRSAPTFGSSILINLPPSRVALLRDQLISRLQFLQWVANHESITFFTSTAQTDVIWKCLVADPIGKQEQDEAFSYLDNIIEYDHFISHFFNNRLPRLDVSHFSDQAFKYAKNCLLKVNTKNSRLRSTSPSTQSQSPLSILVQGDLIGIDLIWDIALRAEEEAVGKEAIVFLVYLHLNTDKKQENYSILARKHRELLVDKCVSYLFGAANGLSHSLDFAEMKTPPSEELAADALKFKRCLQVLKSFMDQFDTKYSNCQLEKRPIRRHGMLNDAEWITVKVNVTNMGASRSFELQIHPLENLLSLRQKIASRIGVSRPGSIRLITSGKELFNESNTMSLKKLKITDRQVFMVMKRPTDGKSTQDSDKMESPIDEEITESDLPVNMLSKHIDRFFSLLELDESYSSQIWDLLMRLPTNSRSLDTLKSLDSSLHWEDILVSRSPFRLLYALQIIDWLLRGGDEFNDGDEWSKRFVKSGGLEYLLSLLIQDSSANNIKTIIEGYQNSVTKRACLGLLLKIISFLAVDNSPVNVDVFKRFESQALVEKLIEIVRKCVDPSQKQVNEDLTIIRHSMKLLTCLCLRDESALSSFIGYPNLHDWLISSLVRCQLEDARILLANIIIKFCQDIANNAPSNGISDEIPPMLESFLAILWSFLPEVEEYVDSSKEYFDLMGQLMPYITNSKNMSLSVIYNNLKQQIKQHPIKEQFNSLNEDTVIVGLTQLMKIIVSGYPEFKRLPNDMLLELIFHDCLFQVSTVDHAGSILPPKCKLDNSRNASFELLNELVKDCPENFFRISELYLKQLDRGEQLNDNWNYCPKTCQKSSAGYVGLQNLGATCYVNSIVQQFYMNSSFRKSLFDAPVLDDNKDESLLYQLQVVFGHLQESEKKAYEATQFCHAYRDYDGQPLNVALQMDVDEYFNGLFDRLESSVSGTSQAMLLKEHFGGTLVQQIKSRDCGHISEKEESFFAIQCEVKNKRNVEESLELYVEGELLDGDNQYFCAKCEKSVDAIKRSCIKTLPKNLIMHLKRFDFDMELLKRVKINEYFEFPTRINMEPYTLDYLIRKESGQIDDSKIDDKSQFEYELVGVLVHTGTADSGHYYSFIRERKPLYEDINECRWYQFNDSTVEIFDHKDIPKQCFGGPECITQWDPAQQKNVSRMFSKQYNAYMLFYERCENSQSDSDVPQNKITNVPVDIYNSVWEENINFLQDKNIFDPGYFNLMMYVLDSVKLNENPTIVINGEEIDLTLRSIQLGTEFVLGVLSRAKENSSLPTCIDMLKSRFQSHLPACQWFISRLIGNNPNYLQQILMSCYVQDVREQIVELIIFVLRTLRNGSLEAYGLERFMIDTSDNSGSSMIVDSTQAYMCHPSGTIVRLCESLFNLFPTAYAYWRNFEQFFYLLSYIANFGTPEREYMIKRGFIGELVKLFLLDEISPLKSRKKRMGDKFSLPPFRYLLVTLQTLLLGCDVTNIEYGDNSMNSGLQSPLKLRDHEIRLLFERKEPDDQFVFFMKQVRDCIDSASSRDIFQHFAIHSKEMSEELIKQLIRAADTYTADHVRPHLEILYSMAQIQDLYTNERIAFTIREVLQLAKANSPNAPQVSSECLGLIEALCSSSIGVYVQQLLLDYLQDWFPDYLLSPYETIRQRAESLFGILVLRKVDEAQGEQALIEATINMRKQYSILLRYIDNIDQCWRTTYNRRGAEPFGWRLSNYFRVLTKCVRSPKEKEMFQSYYEKFGSTFINIDTVRTDCDFDKKEIITFWHKVCEDYPDNVRAFISNVELVSHLHMYYVSISHATENIAYNQSTLPKYYGLILMGCRISPEYHQKWMEAQNFSWALNSMIFGEFYEDHKTDELLELLRISADASPGFRMKTWDQIITSLANSAPLARKIQYMIRLYQYLNRDSIEDAQSFCKSYGFDFMPQYINVVNAVKDKHPDDETMRKCLDVMHNYLNIILLYPSDEVFQSYFKSWKTWNEFVTILVSFLHPNVEHEFYVKATEILCALLKLEYMENIATGLLQLFIDKHSQWQHNMSAITQEDLALKFGGTRSTFYQLNLLGEESENASISTQLSGPSVHVYRPFISKLQNEEILRLQEKLYEPYLRIVEQIAVSNMKLGKYDKVVQLCSLIVFEMMDIDVDRIFDILLGIYEKFSSNGLVKNAYGHIYFVTLIERMLNSDSQILLNMLPEKLSVLKSLIGLVKEKKPDVIQPIVSKHVQQLATNVKVLKEKIESNDLTSINVMIQELLMILQVFAVIISKNDLPVDDSLTQAYSESLRYLSTDSVRNLIKQFDELATISNKMYSLLGELSSQQGIDMEDNGEIDMRRNDSVDNDDNFMSMRVQE